MANGRANLPNNKSYIERQENFYPLKEGPVVITQDEKAIQDLKNVMKKVKDMNVSFTDLFHISEPNDLKTINKTILFLTTNLLRPLKTDENNKSKAQTSLMNQLKALHLKDPTAIDNILNYLIKHPIPPTIYIFEKK